MTLFNLDPVNKLDRLPRDVTHVRDLEAFEGPILSEYRATHGSGTYVEKWCEREPPLSRFLLVRSDPRSIAEYLGGRLPMLKLLRDNSDGIGFVIDRRGAEVVAVHVVPLEKLPRAYFPTAHRFHDEELRPEWEIVPQSYLVDDDEWDATKLAVIERNYLNAASFAYNTKPGTSRRVPLSILDINYEGGYSVMHAFNAIRSGVPPQARARPGGVAVASPGVLTINAPSETATDLANALRALSRAAVPYTAVHAWSRWSPEVADSIPESARDEVHRLCDLLGVDAEKLYPDNRSAGAGKLAILVAGKLIAAYYRVLLRVLEPPVAGVDFVGVQIDRPDISEVEAYEDERETIVVSAKRR